MATLEDRMGSGHVCAAVLKYAGLCIVNGPIMCK